MGCGNCSPDQTRTTVYRPSDNRHECFEVRARRSSDKAAKVCARPNLHNPRASYRAENPTNPKIGQKYQPDIQIPPTAGDRKNIPKTPEKYPKNTKVSYFFLYSGGYLKGYFGESHVLYVGGYFCISLAFLFCSWSRGCQPKSV